MKYIPTDEQLAIIESELQYRIKHRAEVVASHHRELAEMDVIILELIDFLPVERQIHYARPRMIEEEAGSEE